VLLYNVAEVKQPEKSVL